MHAVPELTVALLVPAVVGGHGERGKVGEGLESLAHVLLSHRLELLHAPGVNEVLEAGLLAIVAAAVVALGARDRLDRVKDVVLADETERGREPGEGVVVAVRAAHAAAGVDVVTDVLAILHHDADADVVGQKVDVVIPGDGDADLELAGQELGAVDGFGGALKVGPEPVVVPARHHLRLLDGENLLAVQPHVVVGARLGREEVADVLRELLRDGVLGFEVLGVRRRRRHDVAVDVSARAQRAAHVANNSLEGGLEVGLQDAVQLVRLPGGQTERAVAVGVGEVVHGEVELVRDGARGLLGSHHELVKFPGAERALLAVVLLVPAVELVQLRGILGDERILGGELLDEGMAEKVGVLLDVLNLGPVLLALVGGLLAGGGRDGDDGVGDAARDGGAHAGGALHTVLGPEADEGCGYE